MSVSRAHPGLQLFGSKRRISPVQHRMAVGTYRDQSGFWVQTVVLLYPGQRNEMVDMDKTLADFALAAGHIQTAYLTPAAMQAKRRLTSLTVALIAIDHHLHRRPFHVLHGRLPLIGEKRSLVIASALRRDRKSLLQ